MRHALSRIYTALAIVACVAGCDSGGRWEEIAGPSGGAAHLVGVTSSGVAYARTDDGMYATADASNGWERLPALPSPPLRAAVSDRCVFVVVDGSPERPGRRILYLDAAGAWADCTGGLGLASVRSMAAVDFDAYIVTGAPESGVWVRRAGKQAWTRLDQGLGGTRPLQVAALGRRVLLLAVEEEGLWVQVLQLDAASDTWAPASGGIARRDLVGSRRSPLLTASGGELSYASRWGVGYRMQPDGDAWELLRTTTAGRDPRQQGHTPTFEDGPIVSYGGVAYTTQGYLTCAVGEPRGVFQSTEGSAPWADAPGARFRASSLLATKRELLAGSPSGVYRTTDGSTWRPASDGLGRLQATNIAVLGERLYVGSKYGYGVSTDEGQTWQRAEGFATPGFHLGDSKLGVLNRHRTLTEPGSYYREGERGVSRTTDSGRLWRSAGLRDHGTTWLNLERGRLHALTTDGTLFFSDNEGKRWRRRRPLPGGRIVKQAAASSAYVFAITPDERIYRAPL